MENHDKQSSLQAETTVSPWMTFFTPTYNRCHTLHRVYDSLVNMIKPIDDGKTIDFEWVIVDDGSCDDTYTLVKKWCDEDKIPIRYYFQRNQGKHVATNFATNIAHGKMMTIIDSDDSMFDNTLCIFWKEWNKIPDGIRHKFKGVTARCIDPDSGKIVGSKLPMQPYYTHPQDMRFRDHITGEMHGFNRVDVMKEFPFPVFEEKTHFCPEAIVWFEMGKKYLESIVDSPVRTYFRDTGNAITRGNTSNRSRANYHLWQWELNNIVLKYLFRSPKEMIKAVVGISMDGFRTGRSLSKILKDVTLLKCKIMVLLFSPIGLFLSKREA